MSTPSELSSSGVWIHTDAESEPSQHASSVKAMSMLSTSSFEIVPAPTHQPATSPFSPELGDVLSDDSSVPALLSTARRDTIEAWLAGVSSALIQDADAGSNVNLATTEDAVPVEWRQVQQGDLTHLTNACIGFNPFENDLNPHQTEADVPKLGLPNTEADPRVRWDHTLAQFVVVEERAAIQILDPNKTQNLDNGPSFVNLCLEHEESGHSLQSCMTTEDLAVMEKYLPSTSNTPTNAVSVRSGGASASCDPFMWTTIDNASTSPPAWMVTGSATDYDDQGCYPLEIPEVSGTGDVIIPHEVYDAKCNCAGHVATYRPPTVPSVGGQFSRVIERPRGANADVLEMSNGSGRNNHCAAQVIGSPPFPDMTRLVHMWACDEPECRDHSQRWKEGLRLFSDEEQDGSLGMHE